MMKSLRGKKVYFLTFLKNSLFLYLALAATMLTLFTYVYLDHQLISEIYEKSKVSHNMSVKALLLSEENYHTQLEVYEIFSLPDQKRIDDFYLHEKLFYRQLDETHNAYKQNMEHIPPAIITKFNALQNSTPRIQEHWNRFLKAVIEKKSVQEQRKILLDLEEIFDDENFNNKIKEIVDLQLAEVRRTDEQVDRLIKRNVVLIMFGILITFILSCIITYLHKAALEGKSTELQLVQAGKLASLGQLSAGMAHELNNPLMFITGYNNRIKSLLQKEGFDPKSNIWEYLNEVESGVDRINNIIKHFRDFARLSKNEMISVPINNIVLRSFTLFAEQLRQKQITVNLNLSTDNPYIIADPNRIEQVMLNLISNSSDALVEKQSHKTITVETSIQNQTVVLKFSDTGKGIPKKILSRIFDPFFTTKPVGVGTGLGLSISSGIIRDHKGQIEVNSEVDQGTQFTVTFPLAVSKSEAA